MGIYTPESKENLLSDTDEETKEPPLYKVYLHNDDYTSMEFVVEILIHFFNKTVAEAARIMMKVHREGIGLCGVFTREIAETKVAAVSTAANENGYPLKCTMERE